MLLSLIQLLAGIGVVCLLLAWAINVDMVGIVGGLLGGFTWFLVAYGLFNIETVDASTTHAEPAIALFAAAAGVACLVPAFVDPWDIIGSADDQNDPLERM